MSLSPKRKTPNPCQGKGPTLVKEKAYMDKGWGKSITWQVQDEPAFFCLYFAFDRYQKLKSYFHKS